MRYIEMLILAVSSLFFAVSCANDGNVTLAKEANFVSADAFEKTLFENPSADSVFAKNAELAFCFVAENGGNGVSMWISGSGNNREKWTNGERTVAAVLKYADKKYPFPGDVVHFTKKSWTEMADVRSEFFAKEFAPEDTQIWISRKFRCLPWQNEGAVIAGEFYSDADDGNEFLVRKIRSENFNGIQGFLLPDGASR